MNLGQYNSRHVIKHVTLNSIKLYQTIFSVCIFKGDIFMPPSILVTYTYAFL